MDARLATTRSIDERLQTLQGLHPLVPPKVPGPSQIFFFFSPRKEKKNLPDRPTPFLSKKLAKGAKGARRRWMPGAPPPAPSTSAPPQIALRAPAAAASRAASSKRGIRGRGLPHEATVNQAPALDAEAQRGSRIRATYAKTAYVEKVCAGFDSHPRVS